MSNSAHGDTNPKLSKLVASLLQPRSLGSGIGKRLVAGFFGFMGCSGELVYRRHRQGQPLSESGRRQCRDQTTPGLVKVLDELRSNRGTKVTRLLGLGNTNPTGRRQRQFFGSNDSFTIRRGETVHRRITPANRPFDQSGHNWRAASNFAPSESSTVDDDSTQIVLQGRDTRSLGCEG